MSFYTKSMRYASLILFWMALIVAVTSFAGVLAGSWDMVSGGLASPYEDHSGRAMVLVLTALASALASAAWPFFGSALLWLLDKRRQTSEAPE